MAHITMENMSFTYPLCRGPSLQNISFSVQRGEFIVLWGKSGSGKTTLLRHLKPALAPHGKLEGQVLFDGMPLKDQPFALQASQIGYVMQDPESQIVTDTVCHELAFGLENLGLDSRIIRLRVAEAASRFGLESLFHQPTASLSGGEKQLLNLASVLAMNPSVLILDEPTSQLDPIAASTFLNTVEKVNRELGVTVIITEHRLEEVLYRASRLLILEDGRLTDDGMVQDITNKLKEQSCPAALLEAMPAPLKIWAATDSKNACPLTVRDGRQWLARYFEDKEIPSKETQDVGSNGKKFEDTAVVMNNLWFRYEKKSPDVLKGLSLMIPKGSLFVLMGNNGAGKSTLLKVICNIVKPYSGRLRFAGGAGKCTLVFVPQDPKTILVKKTVKLDLLDALSDINYSDEEKEDHINCVCQLTSIQAYLEKHPYDLSGGQQQQVALAKALLRKPDILLLDEVTKGLDRQAQETLADILKILQKNGITIIAASHDVEFCAHYADLCALLFDGVVVTQGTPKDVLSGNSFYTTAANRMARHLFPNAITSGEVIALCRRAEGK